MIQTTMMTRLLADSMNGRPERTEVRADQYATEGEVSIHRGHSWSLHLSKKDAIEFANAILAAAALLPETH